MELGEGNGEVRQTPSKIAAKDIEILRIAVVKQVPDDLDAGFLRRLDLRRHARKVISSRRALDTVPPQAVASREYSLLRQSRVILACKLFMTGSFDHVQAAAVASP